MLIVFEYFEAWSLPHQDTQGLSHYWKTVNEWMNEWMGEKNNECFIKGFHLHLQ